MIRINTKTGDTFKLDLDDENQAKKLITLEIKKEAIYVASSSLTINQNLKPNNNHK